MIKCKLCEIYRADYVIRKANYAIKNVNYAIFFWAILNFKQVRCFLSNSAILVCHQVCRSLPLFQCPCGFHSSALLTTCPSGLLNVWPIHSQALCLISCSIGRCPVSLQSSLLLIFLGHQIRNTCMFLRLLLMNTCNLCSNPLVNLQVSEPYKSTTFTFDPKTLSLILVVSAVDRHIGLSILNTCLAFPIRAWMSSSASPFLLTMLPRYVNSSTSSIRPPATDTPLPCLVPICINFVLVALIFRPTFAPCTSKACVLSPSYPVFCATVGCLKGPLNTSLPVKGCPRHLIQGDQKQQGR